MDLRKYLKRYGSSIEPMVLEALSEQEHRGVQFSAYNYNAALLFGGIGTQDCIPVINGLLAAEKITVSTNVHKAINEIIDRIIEADRQPVDFDTFELPEQE